MYLFNRICMFPTWHLLQLASVASNFGIQPVLGWWAVGWINYPSIKTVHHVIAGKRLKS